MSSDQVRDTILKVARSLFAQYGFKKTSVDDIARRARIGKGTIYLHFASKEEIFAGVVHQVGEAVLAALESAVRQAPTPEAKIRAFVRTRLTGVAQLLRQTPVSEDAAMELLPLAREFRQAFHQRELKLLEQILQEGRQTGALEVAQPDQLALAVVTFLQAIDLAAVRLVQSPASLLPATNELLEVLVRGLSVNPAAHPRR